MDIKIPTGHEHAVRIPNSEVVIRREIQELNRSGDCIINVGFGYFRPDMNDSKDREYAEQYFATELHRARAIQRKRIRMMVACGLREEI